jgi:hypothetical protein
MSRRLGLTRASETTIRVDPSDREVGRRRGPTSHRQFLDGAYFTELSAEGMADWYRRSRAVGASRVDVVPFEGGWWVVYEAAAPFTAWHDDPARLRRLIEAHA